MAWLVLSNKMDVCYLLVYVQEIRIQPYFCVKQGDYFFPLFAKDPVYFLILVCQKIMKNVVNLRKQMYTKILFYSRCYLTMTQALED